MEALIIFSHGGFVTRSSNARSSRSRPRRNPRRCSPHPSCNLIRPPNSRSGFSSTPPKSRPFFASFAPPPALASPSSETDEVPILDTEADSAGAARRINVLALARKLWYCKTPEDVGEVFDKMPNLPPGQVYSTIIKGLGVDNKIDAAFALFDWLKRKSKDTGGLLGPNIFMYNSLLGALRQSKRFEDVDRVMEDMVEEGLKPNTVTYNALMSIYIKRGCMTDALNVLDRIDKEGLVPSAATYSTALLAYRMMEDASGALAFYVGLRERYERGEICTGTDENWENEFVKLKDYTIRVCYNVMRRCLVSGGDPTADIMKLLADMDRVKLTPGRDEYEKLLWACTDVKHFRVAKVFYVRLRDLDSGIALSVCNHVIWLMGKAKKWWAALEVYEHLLDKGPKPNNMSYDLIMSHFNVLLRAAGQRGFWRWGLRLIDKMIDKGLKPGGREFNAVLVACSKASEAPTAVQVFKRMIDQGEKPTILSYGVLLNALEKGKLYDEAIRVWDHMCKMGIKPNVHTYTMLNSLYIGKGEPHKVDSVIHEMDSSGVPPTLITFNAIISACARNHLSSVALEWYHRMKVRGIAPNEVTYDMLIQSLLQDEKSKLAYEMFKKAHGEGLQLSSQTSDMIFQSHNRGGVIVDPSLVDHRPV